MGVLFAFLNLDKGIYVMPTNVNLKDPDEQPYAAFCIWLIQTHWRGNSVMFMGDSDPAWDGWRDSKDAEMTKRYWDEFITAYDYVFPGLEPEPYKDGSSANSGF